MPDLIYLAVVFLIIALIAYLLGARNVAWFSADLAKIVVWIFIILFILTLLWRLIA